MVRDGRGVSARLVLLLGLVATVLSYLVLHIWTGQGHVLTTPSWGALIVLVFMASGVFFAGLPVRRFLRGQSRKPLNPMRAMRTLVLAQAAALTGALVTGWYAAQVLVLFPDFDVDSQRTLGVRAAALAAGGVLLAMAGLVAQAMCRVDGDPRDRDFDRDRDEEADPSHEH
jgi:hypothetical protein